MIISKKTILHLFVASLLWLVTGGYGRAADVLISEFMAINDSGLRDEDGDTSDWIEFYNMSTTSVSLTGWYLTDSTNDLARWSFPVTDLPTGGFLTIFASGKDRRISGNELHTDFKLSGDGEYLALVRPDGITVEHEYAPQYKQQIADVSYGLAVVELLKSDSVARYTVPTNAVYGTNWLSCLYDDSAWSYGVLPIGFDVSQSVELVSYWPLDGDANDVAANQLDGVVSGAQFSTNVSPKIGMGSSLDFNGTSDYVDLGVTTLLDLSNNFSVAAWIKRDNPGDDMILSCGYSGWGFRLYSDNIRFTTYGIKDYDAGSAGISDGDWHHVTTVFDSNNDATLYCDGVQIGSVVSGSSPATLSGANSWSIGSSEYGSSYLFGGLIDDLTVWDGSLATGAVSRLALGKSPFDVAGFAGSLATDVSNAMHGVAAGLYLRQVFTNEHDVAAGRAVLCIKYDDGFIAYLNGVEVARRCAPSVTGWNALATTNRLGSAVMTTESILLGEAAVLLSPGTNLLAIHCMNVTIDDDDLFYEADLVVLGADGRYFASPTPGVWNPEGVSEIGPFISAMQHAPTMPGDDDPIVVTVEVAPLTTNLAVQSVSLWYRVMYGAETLVAMADDGVAPDLVADDGIYAATILAAVSSPGEMVRWYVEARDIADNASRYPYTNTVARTARYEGTVIADLSIPTNLPVLHWFVPDPAWHVEAGGNNLDWSEACCCYGGQFYDNFLTRVRGSAAQDWPKPKFKFDFNPGDHFRFDPGQRRVEEFNLQSFYREVLLSNNTSYMREPLGLQFMRDAGVPASHSFHLHMRQNGAFYGLYAFVEQVDQTFLERNGYETDAPMYKAIDVPGTCDVNPSTTHYRKVGCKEEPWDDFIDFCYQINESRGESRFTYLMDSVDVAEVINEMAAHVCMPNHDRLTKNYYVYLEPETGEWHRFPWDMDQGFTLGRYLTEENWASPLYGDDEHTQELSGGNPNPPWKNHFYDIILDYPPTREMLLRRVRSLMDQLLDPATGYLTNHVARYDGLIHVDADTDNSKWGAGDIDAGISELLDVNFPTRWSYLSGNSLIPAGEIGIPAIEFGRIDHRPAISQDREYIELLNTNNVAVDISGWSVTGGVEMVFQSGTVMPANSALFITPSQPVFRSRTNGPSGGQRLFVQGPYSGHLSSWGETLVLTAADGSEVDSLSYPADPSDIQCYLRITEIMYHPRDPGYGETFAAEDYEYIELLNTSSGITLDLSNTVFSSGIDYCFDGVGIAPGERIVLVRNAAAFAERFNTNGLVILSGYVGSLDNSGEMIKLEDASGSTVHEFSYSDGWYFLTDGLGASLQVVSTKGDYNSRTNWQASVAYDGTPGEPALAQPPAIVISEVLSHTDADVDWVELHNLSEGSVDIGEWLLSDNLSVPVKFVIPNDTVIAGGGRIVFDATMFDDAGNAAVRIPFAFSELGDEVGLWTGTNNLPLRFVDNMVFGAAEREVTFGRHITSDDRVEFVALRSSTKGSANAYPRTDPIIISEIMVRPSSNAVEFVEIYNTTTKPQPLYDPMHPTNRWSLSGVGNYAFPTGVIMEANAFAIVAPTNPAAFRAAYALPETVAVFGPCTGMLANEGDSIKLWKPGSPEPNGLVPQILVDHISYDDSAPWPVLVDGKALERIDERAFGNDPINWMESDFGGTPGSTPQTDHDGDGLVDNWERFWFGATNATDATATDNPDLDLHDNSQEYTTGTSPIDGSDMLALMICSSNGDSIITFDACSATGAGYFGVYRWYRLEFISNIMSQVWMPAADCERLPGMNETIVYTNAIPGSNIFYRVKAWLE